MYVYLAWQFAVITTEINQKLIWLFPVFSPVDLFISYSAFIWKNELNIFSSSFCIQLVTEHAFEIPDNIRPGHLIKELSKVIRSVEVRTEATLHKRVARK